MISMLVVFYMFIVFFAIGGAMRGWAKELLVSFSVVLALAFITVVETLVPILGPFITSNPVLQFWVRIGAVVAMVMFGYQSPRFSRLAKSTEKRDRIQDLLFGLIMGAISGYMVVGTIWAIAHMSGYPTLSEFVIPPTKDSQIGEATLRLIKTLPPAWLGKPPTIYIAVVLAFVFVIVVFV